MNKFNAFVLSVSMLLSSASMITIAGENDNAEINTEEVGFISKVGAGALTVIACTLGWPSKLGSKITGKDLGIKTDVLGWAAVATVAGVVYKLHSDAKKAEQKKKLEREILDMIMADLQEEMKSEQEDAGEVEAAA